MKWIPSDSKKLEGEVKEDTLYIYTVDSNCAVDTLYHEYFDYLVSKAIKPYETTAQLYRAMLMTVIRQVGEEAYNEKERVVEVLKKVYYAYRSRAYSS